MSFHGAARVMMPVWEVSIKFPQNESDVTQWNSEGHFGSFWCWITNILMAERTRNKLAMHWWALLHHVETIFKSWRWTPYVSKIIFRIIGSHCAVQMVALVTQLMSSVMIALKRSTFRTAPRIQFTMWAKQGENIICGSAIRSRVRCRQAGRARTGH